MASKIESQGFTITITTPEISDFEIEDNSFKRPVGSGSIKPMEQRKYPPRIALQSSSSELAIISNRNMTNRINNRKIVGAISQKPNGCSTAASSEKKEPHATTFADFKPPIRISRLRQRHTCHSTMPECNQVLGRQQSESFHSPRASQASLFIVESDNGGGTEAIFRSRNHVGKKLANDLNDSADEESIQEFCLMEALSKVLEDEDKKESQLKINTKTNENQLKMDDQTKESQLKMNDQTKESQLKMDDQTKESQLKMNNSIREFQLKTIKDKKENELKIDNETKDVIPHAVLQSVISDIKPEKESCIKVQTSLLCSKELENENESLKQSQERIEQLEASKKICDAEIRTLRDDLRKALELLAEKSRLVEELNPKEEPPWVVPSKENTFQPHVDYFSFRTFSGRGDFSTDKLYPTKLYLPGHLSQTLKKENKVSFKLPPKEEKVVEKKEPVVIRTRTSSAPAGKTYLNIRHQQTKITPPLSKYSSARSSLESVQPKWNQTPTKNSIKPRSVPLSPKPLLKKPPTNKTNDQVGANPVANAEYLAIALASREGLIREIAHSVKKAKKILHFRFNMLISSNFASEDLHFLLTSHRRFLRWLNNYIHYSANLINRFDDKYMKSRSFFLPATLDMDEDTLKGIFIPVPKHNGSGPPIPYFVDKGVQTLTKSTLAMTSSAARPTNCKQTMFVPDYVDKSCDVRPRPRTLLHQFVQTTVSTTESSVQTKKPPPLINGSSETLRIFSSDKSGQTMGLFMKPARPCSDKSVQISARVRTPTCSQLPHWQGFSAMTQTESIMNIHGVSVETQWKILMKDMSSNTNSEHFEKISKKISKQFESKCIQSLSNNDGFLNLKPAPSTRNVALQYISLQSPAPSKFEISTQNDVPSVNDSSVNDKEPDSKINFCDFDSKIQFQSGTVSPSNSQNINPTDLTILKTTSFTIQSNDGANKVINEQDSAMDSNMFSIEELWNKNIENSNSRENKRLFQHEMCPEEMETDIEETNLNFYDEDPELDPRLGTPSNEEQKEEENHNNLSLLESISKGLSPLNFVTPFQEETAEKFYNHGGNVHLRVLDEDKLFLQSAGMLGDFRKPLKNANPYACLDSTTPTIEQMTTFFEETVAKFKQKQSDAQLEDGLPKFKSAAEVVLDILTEGQDVLSNVSSDDTLSGKYSYSSIDKDSDILEIDPEYEALFDLALQETPNVDEEFERLYNEEEPVPINLPRSQCITKTDDNVRQLNLHHQSRSHQSKISPMVPVAKKSTSPNELSKKVNIDRTVVRASRLPVRISKIPQKLNLSLKNRDPTPGIIEEPIPVQLKATDVAGVKAAKPVRADSSRSSTGRKSLIPVSSKPKATLNCPTLAQVSLKRIEKPTTLKSIIPRKSNDISVQQRVLNIEKSDVAKGPVLCCKRKSVSKIWTTSRKVKVSSYGLK